ncbi:hypothetical protein QR680_011114 [Steinernema hermaphroditum]|uniref:T-cell immunomodulatory protein TIP C2 domain-containing protein n=1 Tax=Steinernema hermaphroditum TaxID=289476 RepID=A0AA39MCA5_9BILA|nr:hypothetical protein QR680_011114 [Steinernema hermaphroditum]
MFFTFLLTTFFVEVTGGGIDGRVCAFGDINKDRYTDIIVQIDNYLKINLQTERGAFISSPDLAPIDVGLPVNVQCVVGDFNGDAAPDILVSKKSLMKVNQYETAVYISHNSAFKKVALNAAYFDQPIVVDLNGDGISDILGFVYDDQDEVKPFCVTGSRTLSESTKGTNCSDYFQNLEKTAPFTPIHGFPPIFADLDGDLSSELVFGMEDKTDILRFDVWKRNGAKTWDYDGKILGRNPLNSNFKYFGGAVVGDIDANGLLDVMVPVCREEECQHVDNMLLWTKKRGWNCINLDLKGHEIVGEPESKVLFRIGDFNLDGYPDLIASLLNPTQKRIHPMILENVRSSDVPNITRTFELQTNPLRLEPTDMANGDIKMATFFDLKENGGLDIIVEYEHLLQMKHDFIRCENKGDTTFLKVQTFTSVCANDCPGHDGKLGSGISWHGACTRFSMADTWGETKQSAQCQMPQTSHRSLALPYVLFGLGRSPNFVDKITLGSPQYPERKGEAQKIVPNSRLVVIPPEFPSGTKWTFRQYIIPSRLLIQSLPVFAALCVLLSSLIVFLHYREVREDRKERQMETNRFHFDAL